MPTTEVALRNAKLALEYLRDHPDDPDRQTIEDALEDVVGALALEQVAERAAQEAKARVLYDEEARIRFMVSESRDDREPCICCPRGEHVFAMGLDPVDGSRWSSVPGRVLRGLKEKHPSYNGKKVRVVVELVDAG